MMVASGGSNGSGLRVGMRFHPTDRELVGYYLHTRIASGDNFRSDFVSEFPAFYGDTEPWLLWDMYGGDSGDSEEDGKTLYFFTRRRRLSPNSKTFDRKVGSGTWSAAQNLNKVLDFDGVVIGIKREFRNEGGSDSLQNCAWLMQEYEMVDDHPDLVLCALKKSPRFAPPAQTSSTA